MTDWLLPALAGFGTGILSAWGVGGGTLLLLLMTLFLGVDQTQAQGGDLGRHHGIPQAVRRFPALGGRQYAAAKKEMRQCRTHCLIFHTKQVCTSSI